MNEFFEEDGFGFDGWDTNDVNPEDCESKRTVDKAGKYHFEIGAVTPKPEKEDENGNPRKQSVLLTCVVLHSVKGQSPAGSIYYHELIISAKGGGEPEIGKRGIRWDKVATCSFLAGLGFLNRIGNGDENDKFVDPVSGSSNLTGEFWNRIIPQLEGFQFIGDIKHSKGGDKKDPETGAVIGKYPDQYDLPFGKGAYAVNHPAVADVPKNQDALAMFVSKGGTAPVDHPPASTGSTKPPTAPAQQSQGEFVPTEADPELAGL